MKRSLCRFATALTVSVLVALPSFSHADFIGGAGTYVKDRFHDTLDLFRLRGGFPNDGKGIGAKARVTSLAQVGYVSFDGKYVGIDRRGVGLVDEQRREAGVSVLYGSFNTMDPRWGNGFLRGNTDWSVIEDRRIIRNLPHWDDGRQRYLSVGGEVATPLFALDIGVYPEEALDLVLGFFVIDIYNDDELFGHDIPYRKATTPPVPDKEAPFAAKRVENAAFLQEMERKQAEEIVGSQATPLRETTLTEVPVEIERESGPTSEGLISARDADRAIEDVSEKPSRRLTPPEAEPR